LNSSQTALQASGDGLILSLYIQTRASRDEILGPHGDCIKIRITAAPVDGKANQHLLRYLSQCFGVSQNRVVLLGGEGSKHKRVRIIRPGRIPAMFKL
jgi:uncharacterized protein (TIGR00251 family)